VREKEREKVDTDREIKRERGWVIEEEGKREYVLVCLLQTENDFTLDTNYEFLILKEKYN
jgi:hypothetical protein